MALDSLGESGAIATVAGFSIEALDRSLTLPAPLRGKRDEVYERLLIAYSRLPFICFGILMRILIKNIYLLVIL